MATTNDSSRWMEALDRAPDAAEMRPLNSTRAMLMLLSGAVFALIVWAGITPVNEITASYGQVVPSGHVQVIQHLEGGIVQRVAVQEGERVQAGQLLVEMHAASTRSDLEQLQKERVGLLMERIRIQAALDGKEPDFSSLQGVDAQVIHAQERAYSSTQQSREQQAEVIRAQISQRQKALRAAQARSGMLSKNLSLAGEGLAIKEKLYEKGYYSRLNYLEKQEQLNSMRGEDAALAQEIQRLRSEISEYETRLSSLKANSQEESYDSLTRLNTSLSTNEAAIAKYTDRMTRLQVRAPIAGVVKGIEVTTVGGIVGPGQKLMELVPLEGALMVEARIRPSEIGQLHPGLPVHVKVHAFDFTRYGEVEGTLERISATTFVDEQNQTYYRGTVALKQDYVGRFTGQNQLVPGMTVDADIVTGKRSLLSYLLTPVRRAADTAFTEH